MYMMYMHIIIIIWCVSICIDLYIHFEIRTEMASLDLTLNGELRKFDPSK